MNSFIVEDSRLARVELKELLKAHPQIRVCGDAGNPRDALPIITKERPDLLFLDINMPGSSGFELLQQLDYEPQIIFVTAYAEHALRSFEFATVDYLLKPVTAERLKAAIDKLSFHQTAKSRDSLLTANSRVLLRNGESCHWVPLQNIHYFESATNHTHVYWGRGSTLIHRALGKIEERLPQELFFRANRQQILNVNEIADIDVWFNKGYRLQLKSGVNIEISRRHATRFKEFFSL